MPRQFVVVIEKDKEGYDVATVPALRGCHTQARSFDELTSRIGEHVEALDFVGVQQEGVAPWRESLP